jgi:hypothetical protein
MMEAGISAEPEQSSRSTPFGRGGVLANLWQRLVEIATAAAIFFRPSRVRSTEDQVESGAVEPEGAVVTVALAAETTISGPQIEAGPHSLPSQHESKPQDVERQEIEPQEIERQEIEPQEIERRRHLVRLFFNDFWDGAADKPAAFVTRLDQAEHYLNERLAANGESWRVDAKTRPMLGLPPRATSVLSGKQISR